MSEMRDFDKVAATWDEEPRRVALANAVAAAVIAAARPNAAMDVMDFGCGTGLLTMALQPLVGTITGVDSSRGMLAVLEQKVRKQDAHNVRTLLCETGSWQRPQGWYHLIVSSMTLHHVPDLAPLFRLFHELLLPGGLLCLADLEKEDGSFHDNATGIAHFGFDPEQVKTLAGQAGFAGANTGRVTEIWKQERQYPVFLLTTRKP